ncbi:MAG: hypothetical protein QOG54_157 [Actinomycetota bacterium]|jgi:hypothetical protein|nr:hypothetical protein [Actinomycetota bacterium]
MSEFLWILHDEAGADLRQTDAFASKEEAEAWMGAEWSALLDEGAESVSLVTDGEVLYKMSLQEA